MKEIRVSYIANMAWCEVKAKALIDGFEIKKTADMEEGRQLHKMFGYDEDKEASINYGNYRIVGHADKLLDNIVFEFKTYRENYPINYLIAVASTQANLYAYLFKVRYYVVIVYNVQKKTFWGFMQDADYVRAENDIEKAISIFEGKVQAKPTTVQWKCDICELRGVVCDRNNKS